MFENILAEPTKANLNSLLAIYMAAVVVLLVQQWNSKRAVGLPMAYALAYSMLHAISAFVYGLPHYSPKSDILVQGGFSLTNTFVGFRVACFGFCAYVLGVLLSGMIFRRDPQPKVFQMNRRLMFQMPGTLLIISCLAFFGAPILKRVPSFGSMSTAGAYVSVIAVFYFCHMAYQAGDKMRLLLGVLSTACFPFVTIIFLGFAGYGSSAASMVWMMVLRFYRPRWLALGVLGLVIFGGLTFYVNWMREREQIRSSVWGQRSMEERMERFYSLVTNFELLNWNRQYHLELIDGRLNQNDIVGKAVRYINSGKVDYADGYTLWVAATAWIPRILWPSKPATGGSGGVVAHFTGQKFAEGTSVGAGNPMEFYINFGWPGVFWGFIFLGIFMAWFDRRAAFYLEYRDYWSAARWLLPGLGLIQPGGLIAEATGSCAAYAVFTWGCHQVLFKKFYEAGSQLQAARAAYADPRGKAAKPLPHPRYPL